MKYFIPLAIIIILCVPVVTSAASFEFTELQSPSMIGDTIRVSIYIDAKDESVSIAGAHIMFPRESLWAKSFTVAPGWLIAPDEEYNSIDNGRGTLHATAGFEGSFSGRMPFGTLEFVAVGPGTAEIGVAPDPMILNARNEDVADSNTLASRIVITSLESAPETPTQLFDIRLLLEQQVFSPEDPITLRAHFNSFGIIPTPVNMFFTITDESGKIFATSDESLVVETDAVFTKRLEHLDLPPGAYEMHMNTRYNVEVEDDFHVSFLVRRSVGEYYLFGGVVLLVLVACMAYGFWSRRKSPRYAREDLKANH